MISELQREALLDIFENTEVLDKISIIIDETTNTATISYYDMDEEWLNELIGIGR